jgi:hypothetical protein
MVIGTHEVTYKLTDAFSGALLAELPLAGVTFTLGMNQAGPFQGTLDVEDPLVQSIDWLNATRVNRSGLWVDIDGSIAWGGAVTDRTYTLSKSTLSLSGQEWYYYFGLRLQAADYGALWASTPVPSTTIASRVMSDALAAPYSLPITVVVDGVTPSEFWIPFSAPITQRLSVDMIVRELAQMGYPVGFDIAGDPFYLSGIPTAQITLSYPQRGTAPPSPPLVMDLANAIEFTYDENGTSQANGMVEMLSGSGGVSGEAFSEASLGDGWPLLEAMGSHSSMSSIPAPDAVVEAFLTGDLALRAYPLTVATVTYPLFDDTGMGAYPSWGDWQVGDDVLVILKSSADIPANPRFPDGLSSYFRIVSAEVTIKDEGVSTVKFTLNVPPSNLPILPPGI